MINVTRHKSCYHISSETMKLNFFLPNDEIASCDNKKITEALIRFEENKCTCCGNEIKYATKMFTGSICDKCIIIDRLKNYGKFMSKAKRESLENLLKSV